MTRAEVKATVRALLGTNDSTNLFSDTVLNTFCNLAQTTVAHKILLLNPELMAVSDISSVTPSSENNDYHEPVELLDDDDPIFSSIWAVYWFTTTGRMSNKYKLEYLPQRELAGIATLTGTPQYYAIGLGNREITILPWPTVLGGIEVYGPRAIAPFADDTTEVFGGILPELHDLVVYAVLRLASARSREDIGHFIALEREAWEAANAIIQGPAESAMGYIDGDPYQ